MLDSLNQNTAVFASAEIHETQLELELTYSKYQLLPRLRQEFIDAGFAQGFTEIGLEVDFGIELMAQMHLHKRTEPATMIGILRRFFEKYEHPASACALAIEHAVKENVLDFDPLANQLIVRFQVTADVQTQIDRFQYPLPMVEHPLPVTNNKETGYFSIRRSAILKNNHHDDDICLDHLNRVNAQPLSINLDVLSMIQNTWKNLDKPKTGELAEDFQKRVKAFKKYNETSRDVLNTLLMLSDRFWLTHAYDKRGRTYARGYHVNYQGNDWCKAMIQFAEPEHLNKQ